MRHASDFYLWTRSVSFSDSSRIAWEPLHLSILAQYMFASIVPWKRNTDVLEGQVRTRCLLRTKQSHGEADILPRVISHRCESIAADVSEVEVLEFVRRCVTILRDVLAEEIAQAARVSRVPQTWWYRPHQVSIYTGNCTSLSRRFSTETLRTYPWPPPPPFGGTP